MMRFVMAPSFQDQEPPGNPARFTVPVALGAGQQALELLDKGLPPLGVGPSQQLLGFLPGQLEAVQSRADGLATAAAAEALAHIQHQPREGLARRRVGPF